MNQHLQNILRLIEQNKNLSAAEKESALKSLKDADKELEITSFKLEITEKVKKTTAILLEETIEELEQKRKAVEAQNRELEIEAALERARAVAMSMHKSDDLLNICEVSFKEFQRLGFDNIRNAIIHVPNDEKRFFMDYDFSEFAGGAITKIEYGSHPIVDEYLKQIRRAEDAFFEVVIEKNQLQGWKDFRKKSGQYDDPRLDNAEALYYYLFSIGIGDIGISTFDTIDDSQIKILKRFRNVFDLAYRRYNDIALAETQAREAQIEAALERVRSSAMAMHNSNDISSTTTAVFEELGKLNIKSKRCGIALLSGNSFMGHVYAAATSSDGKFLTLRRSIDMTQHQSLQQQYESWKKQENYFIEMNGDELKSYYQLPFFFSSPDYVPPSNYERTEYGYYIPFPEGLFYAWTEVPYTENEIDILKRFKRIVDLTFRRFFDLQKAEAQTREAQIETALEKVRSRTMGMQKSEELKEVIQVVYEQFVQLKIFIEHTGFIIDYKARDDMNIWLADKHEVPFQVTIPYFDSPHWNSFIEAKENKMDFFANHLDFEEKNRFYQDLFKLFPVPDETKEYYLNCPGLAISTVLLENVGLYIENFSGIPYTDEENNTLMRFGKVFQQTYTRFLDLQKAEAQAREARIEAALERTRTQSMLMQHSGELDDTLRVFHEQVLLLGINSEFSYLWLPDEDKDRHIFWAAWAEKLTGGWTGKNGSTVFKSKAIDYPLDRNDPATALCLTDWKSNVPIHSYYLQPAEVENYFASWKELFIGVERLKPENFPHGLYYVEAYMKYGCFGVMINSELSEDEKKILSRFSIEFERTYTRFLDLQKAEAQARESQIEAALERVRSRTMAMHKTDELLDAAELVYKELSALGVTSMNVSYAFVDEDEKYGTYYSVNPVDGKVVPFPFVFPHTETDVMRSILSSWKKQEPFNVIELDEDATLKHQTYIGEYIYKLIIKNNIDIPFSVEAFLAMSPKKAVLSTFNFTRGYLFNIGGVRLSKMQEELLLRFTRVFEQTYTRFLDLQKAEAQAREAVKQASLDRVRAEIASMRTSEDLNLITSVIWRELKTLEVPFIRCGVFIVNEEKEKIQVYLTTPDGKPLAALNLSAASNKITSNAVDYWRNKQVYHEHWNKNEFISWTKSMIGQGQIQNAETYQGTATPPESLDLHFVPFTQGMLYVGNTSPLTDEKIQLVKSLAEAFSIAYARYEDFKNLEVAKNKVEVTLSELKSAQTQLIHSEKMASLGELTAGIAHEIKNPLNFVNNFSELSKDLLDEMKTELENNNRDEVISIAEDLKQNLEKINQHGKRADSIVKGMLLHSRGSSGEKTLTDINDLLDQYVNLAYHGMRAQDKEFNITIEKDYDVTLEKINVIPQDISRVFLNIINNACYASFEKMKRSSDNNFFPTLKVSTKSLAGKVQIKIGDNGNGIPANIIDKIFQPFFTTKPTGEGTGLGLSLSYDIVTKAHGGELTVETIEGEETEFIVKLPVI